MEQSFGVMFNRNGKWEMLTAKTFATSKKASDYILRFRSGMPDSYNNPNVYRIVDLLA